MWFHGNKLSPNLHKTKIMLFGNCGGNAQIQLHINEVEIERVYETKFLRVTIDHKLSWKSHIKHVQTKISRASQY